MFRLNSFFKRKQKVRVLKERRGRFCLLENQPQKLGTVRKLLIVSPKKPNSAKRKIAKLEVSLKTKVRRRFKRFIRRLIFIYIPGQGPHNLILFNKILFRGGRVRDLPGLRYKAIRGKNDYRINSSIIRLTSRSKYGTKKMYVERASELNVNINEV